MDGALLNVGSVLLWGFVATVTMTTILSGGHGVRLTRLSFPLLLGTMASANVDRARVYGFAMHFLNGWLFSLVYASIFEALARAEWWLGAVLGVLHGLFVLTALLPLWPSVHPRMASGYQQPAPTALLEPPGFLGVNYGKSTFIVVLSAHLAYGMILGAFYNLV